MGQMQVDPTQDCHYARFSPDSQNRFSSRNLFTRFREYLTREITPQHNGCIDLHKVPSHELLHRNTSLYNEQKIEALSAGGSVFKPLQPGSERACVLTLVATALGSGVLALPYAFSQVGLVAGLLVQTVAAGLSCMSLVILMVASRYTEAHTYASLLTLATGSPAAGLLLDACQVLYGCSAILALLIFEGDFVPAILEAFGVPNPGRTLCILMMAACAWPLVLPTKVSVLRYVAACSPFAILFVAGSVVMEMPLFFFERHSEPVLFKVDGPQLLQASSIFFFSVMCHTNAVPVAHMLERPSVARIVKVAMYTDMVCWVLYVLIGVGGYLSFQAAVQGDFVLNYPVGSKAMLCCRVMLALVCYVGVPMNSSNCVLAVQKLVTAAVRRDPEPEVEEAPFFFALLATLVLALASLGAVYLHDVATVISLVGGSLTTLQMFWLPAVIYWRLLYALQPRFFRKVVMGSMVSAGIVGFSSLAVALRH